MQNKQDKLKSHRSRNIVSYLKEHAFINGYLYYELIGALSEQNDANIETSLTKLCITTACQLILKCIKSPERNDDENHRKK